MQGTLSSSVHATTNHNTSPESKLPGDRRGIALVLAAALAIRLVFFFVGMDKGLFYPDEYEYVELAKNLAEGNGFSYKGQVTSFRPPGFAFLMAFVFWLFDTTSPVPVRAMQLLFSLVTVWIIYLAGRDGWGERVGLVAAGIFAFYPSLIGFNQILLTEPSFIFCISLACWAMIRHLRQPNSWWAIGAGAALGLGALIRDTLFYAGPVTVLFLIGCAMRNRRYRVWQTAALAGGFLIAILPWIIRNSLLHGQLAMISTVGGVTFYMCNYEKAPIIRSDSIFFERPISDSEGYYYETLLPELNGLSELDKQSAAVRKGLAYMIANPGVTVLRMLARLVDFWGQERLVINQFLAKYYGAMPMLAIFLIIAAVFFVYSVVVIGAVFGYFFTRLQPFDVYGLLFIAYYTAMHLMVFAHPRYHMPLLPFLIIVAARAWLARSEIFAQWRSWRFAGASSITGAFVAMWIIGIFFFDADKLEMLSRFLK
ncbi:MAG: glycosyltransferase family 39 protein [candidate division KSB1 bacterium]|nr:glycosyltransferase family 39 protein [candidate division KSB1 bacterium]